MRSVAVGAALFAAGFVVRDAMPAAPVVQAQGTKVFELRTYTSPEGKLPNLQARFRDHTRRIFDKHGMRSIGYWVPQDTPNTLIYIISHDSREQAKQNWAAFGKDPEWQKVAQESQVDGKIVAKVDSVFMTATDYSAIK
ncbi:MAG: NIPSNAP family protein [Acidimicrobiia bacterium]|nr:NIPSNAP family protein [Acidimicrobiia bacterium]